MTTYISNVSAMAIAFAIQILFEVFYAGGQKKRARYRARLLAVFAVGALLSAGLSLPYLFDGEPRARFILYSALLIPAFLFFFFMFETKVLIGVTVGFYAVFSSQILRLIVKFLSRVIFPEVDGTAEKVFSSVLLLVVSAAALLLLFFVQKKRTISFDFIKLWQVILFGLGGSMILLLTFFEDAIVQYDRGFYIAYLICEIGCSVLLLLLQLTFIFEMRSEVRRITAENLMKKSDEQYEKLLENINIINIKAHDLKHRSTITPAGEKELYELASEYDSFLHTGNRVLDVVLTEKSLRCNLKGILFTCVADGEKLDFMSEEDICSLFGNALDNAIECEEKMPEEDRFIDVKILEKNSFVTIHIENYYTGSLKLRDDLPSTTKGDELFHGFGMRSMKMICEKYKGSMSLKIEDDMFQLDFAFEGKTD